MRGKRSGVGPALKALLLPCLTVCAILGLTTAVGNLGDDRAAEDLKQLETAIRRSCVACFAAEGSYPQDLDYLKDHYGLQVDEERYAVYFDVFAENLMPDITVLELER